MPDEILGPINDVTGLLPEDGLPYNVDQWDGYTADRREVFKHIRDHQVADALFVTGDIHSGLGVRAALRPGDLPGRRLRGRRVRLHVGDVQQPQGHHRHAAAHDQHRGRGRRSWPTTGTSSTSTSTTTATRSSTSPASARRWTGSSSATAPTGTPRSRWTRSMATNAGTGKLHEVDGPVGR